MLKGQAGTRDVEIALLGERLASLRLCDAAALAAVRRSLERHGQLGALTLFVQGDGLEILDGFKRVRAARALGWSTLLARVDDVGVVEAKLRLCELHDGQRLTELEEAWLVRSLYRDDGLRQSEIARRMRRHKNWVCRRLMLVESLEPAVQAHVRLGLVAARAAVSSAGCHVATRRTRARSSYAAVSPSVRRTTSSTRCSIVRTLLRARRCSRAGSTDRSRRRGRDLGRRARAATRQTG